MRRSLKLFAPAIVAALALPTLALAREQKISIDEIPAAVASTVKHRFADATVKGAAKETEHGKPVYEVTLLDQGRNVDVTLTPAGEMLLIEKTIPESELPAPVSAALAKKYAGATYKSIEQIVEVKGADEHLAYYEVALSTAAKKWKEVRVTPDGAKLSEEHDEDEGEYGETD